MWPKLIDFEGGKVGLTVHCYNLAFLNDIIEAYPKKPEHIKLISYLFYMTYPGPDNPYCNVSESELSEMIIQDLKLDVSLDDSLIDIALEKCRKLYTNRTTKSYRAMCVGMEKLEDYLMDVTLRDGKEGNISGVQTAIKNHGNIRESFKKVEADFEEEGKSTNWGGKEASYDQRK